MFAIENILTLLKGYRTNVRTIRQLEFELAQIQNLFTEEDVILSLALSAPDGDTVSTGRISDRTFDTALRYQDEAGSIREALVSAIHRELADMQLKVSRLEHYVCLLEDEPRLIITSLFFEGKTLEKVSEVLDITPKTLASRRQKAIILLVEMYNKLDEIYSSNQ